MTPGIGLETGKLLTADYRKELDMIFSFDHLENPGKSRFDHYQYDLNYYKKYMINWMESYPNNCQMSLFFENHDNPRMVSKVDPNPEYREVLAKLLAVMQMTLRGTPFIFQGQELGMVNKNFTSIDQLRDVESLNLYSELLESMTEADAFKKIMDGTRDHSRTPMQWNSTKYGGFSDTEPWIGYDDDYKICNAEAQEGDKESVLTFYREIIKLRKEHESLVYGDIEIVNKRAKDLFTYYRKNETGTIYIECNLSSKEKKRKGRHPYAVKLVSNYPDIRKGILRPYEAIVWKMN